MMSFAQRKEPQKEMRYHGCKTANGAHIGIQVFLAREMQAGESERVLNHGAQIATHQRQQARRLSNIQC